MIKKMLNFISLLIVFLSFNNIVLAEENVDLSQHIGSTGVVATASGDVVDLGSHFGSSGATYTDGNYYYGFDRIFTDTLITNQFHVISGYESSTPPNDVVYISSSYFQFSNFGSQCGDSNFSFSNFVEIDYEFYDFIDKVNSVYYNETACAITSRTDTRVYFTCTAPYVSNSQLYIYYDRIPSYPTYSAPVSIGRIVDVSCPGQNQIIIDQNNQIITNGTETNDKLDDLNNNITSEEGPDTSGLSDVAGWLPPGPVDSLINLPLSLFNSISRDLSSSCSPITLPLPYVNKDLTLPCMSTFYEGIGIGNFMDWIGIIASGFILFSYLMKLYKWVDDTLTFRENNHLDNWGGV